MARGTDYFIVSWREGRAGGWLVFPFLARAESLGCLGCREVKVIACNDTHQARGVGRAGAVVSLLYSFR